MRSLVLKPLGRRFRFSQRRLAAAIAVELLEDRLVLNATLVSAIAPVNVAPGSAATTINLDAHFNDPLVTGTAVQFQTTQGAFDLGLFDQKTPMNVADFLHYVNNHEYDGTVIQRVIPGFIAQGGGFTPDQNHIPVTFPSPMNEPVVSNTTGTISMALSGPNTATSDWFINLANNTQLDTSTGGFTAFGQVLYSGMQVVNQIVGLPKGMVPPNFVPFQGDPPAGDLPLMNYGGGAIIPANYVLLTHAQVVPKLAYTVTSDNPALVNPTLNGGSLVLTYGPGMGVAHLNVAAADLGGNVATATFTVSVGSTAVNVGAGSGNRIVRFAEAGGGFAQVSITGPGVATLALNGSGLTQTTKHGVVTLAGTTTGVSISTAGTTAASTLNITGRGPISVSGITANGPLRAINARTTSLSGGLTAAGSVAQINLASASNGTIMTGAGAPVSLKIGSGSNENIRSAGAIALLAAGSWGAGATISAPSIAKVAIKNFFAPDLSTGSIGTFSAGSITGGMWTVSGSASAISARTVSGWNASFNTLGRLSINGAFDSSTARAAGNVGTVTALSMNGANIYAGVGPLPSGQNLPMTPGDFTAASAIASVRVARSFANSNVAAATLGRLALGAIQTSNNGMPFGVAGHTIASLTGTAGGKRLRLADVTTQAAVSSALTAEGIAAQDLVIRIV